MSFFGGLLGGLASVLGGVGSSAMSYFFSREMQDRQNSWMEKMSNTAHQREVKDLVQAGLNPILSTGGTGASTPQAGSALQSPVNLDPTTAYMAYRQFKREEKLTNSQVDLNDSQIGLNNANAFSAKSVADFNDMQTELLKDFGPQLKLQELNNLVKQGQVLDSQSAKNMNDIMNNNRRTSAEIVNLTSSAKNYKESATETQRSNEWYKKHPLIYGAGQVTGAIGNIFRSSLSKSVK